MIYHDGIAMANADKVKALHGRPGPGYIRRFVDQKAINAGSIDLPSTTKGSRSRRTISAGRALNGTKPRDMRRSRRSRIRRTCDGSPGTTTMSPC